MLTGLFQTTRLYYSKCWRGLLALGMLASLWVVGFLASSCSTPFKGAVVVPPQIDGATFVGNKACTECHSDYAQKFHSNPHARLHIAGAEVPGGIGCESCHGPGSKHVRSGGNRSFIHNPGKNPEACFSCHTDTHIEFKLPQHHPVLEGKMNCVQCHDPHGMDIFKPAGGLGMARQNESCAGCHREQSRQFVFEHEALRDGCVTCHAAHGSINDKMLVQRDNNLCLKCHAQVHSVSGDIYIGETPHTTFLQRGSCWTSGCHTAVHGSNIDSHLRY